LLFIIRAGKASNSSPKEAGDPISTANYVSPVPPTCRSESITRSGRPPRPEASVDRVRAHDSVALVRSLSSTCHKPLATDSAEVAQLSSAGLLMNRTSSLLGFDSLVADAGGSEAVRMLSVLARTVSQLDGPLQAMSDLVIRSRSPVSNGNSTNSDRILKARHAQLRTQIEAAELLLRHCSAERTNGTTETLDKLIAGQVELLQASMDALSEAAAEA
jgi:hypothetical protein